MLIGYFAHYRGYVGTIEYNIEDGYYGKIVGIEDLVCYDGSNVEYIYEMFNESVDEYIQVTGKVINIINEDESKY